MAKYVRCGLTTKLTDRHQLTYENQKLQGKSPGANGGSVQRFVRCHFVISDLLKSCIRRFALSIADSITLSCSNVALARQPFFRPSPSSSRKALDMAVPF